MGETDDEEDADLEPFVDITATCQKSNVKAFFSTTSEFVARLPAECVTAGAMRHVLGRYLPPKGKILAERPGKGLVTLQNSDPVPERVTVSEFHGSRNFYTLFTPRQSFVTLYMMKTMFERAAMQRKLDQ